MSDASSDEAGGGGRGGFPASDATAAAAGRGGVLPLSLGGLAPSDRAVSAGEEEHDNGTQENHDFAGAADGSIFPASAAAAAAAAGVLPKFPYFSRGSGPSILVGLRSLTHAPIGSSRSRHRSW